MLHITNPVIKHKTGLLNLAEELSNVSKACKIMGGSGLTLTKLPSQIKKYILHSFIIIIYTMVI